MRAPPTTAVLISIGLVLTACESTASPPPSAAPSTPTTASSPAAPSAVTPPAPPAATSTTSCLMTHICGCNLGCARIAVDPKALREGMRATAQTGTYAGKELLVTKETDTGGASVFALSDRDHAGACEREGPASKSLMGFACASKDSGAVPAKACATGCE